MPPRRAREQPSRNAAQQSGLAPELITKRTKRHLDELERSNYAEPSVSLFGVEEGDGGGRTAKGRVRQTISDKRNLPEGIRRKKATANVRTALVYRKTLATLIDESGIASMPPGTPTYLTAAVDPPKEPPRLLCSVCGYWGAYKCKKCAMPYCDMNCQSVHDETRCERRVL